MKRHPNTLYVGDVIGPGTAAIRFIHEGEGGLVRPPYHEAYRVVSVMPFRVVPA